MKRQKRKSKRPARQPRQERPTAQISGNRASRRAFLTQWQNLALATLVVGSGSWFAVREVRATIREHDLTQIGNGTPTIVQIHDPQCSLCVALQRETRDALCGFDDAELQFLVANARSPEGRDLAQRHGVGHVTLLLFDADGRRRAIMTGPQESAYLKDLFRRHFARYGNG